MEITEERRADVLILPNPKPAITKAVSEDGETESRGHPSTEVALWPRRTQHHLGWMWGGVQGTAPLPTATGLAGLACSK
jgi:hypothetical protein